MYAIIVIGEKMKGIKLRRIITTAIILGLCIYVVPIIASIMFKSTFKDLYVGIEDSISQDIEVAEAKVSKSEGYMYIKKRKQDVGDIKYLAITLLDDEKEVISKLYVDIDKELPMDKPYNKMVLEKIFNAPEVNYAYVNKIDRLPKDVIIEGILWGIDEYNNIKRKIEDYTGVYISPLVILRILAGYIVL